MRLFCGSSFYTSCNLVLHFGVLSPAFSVDAKLSISRNEKQANSTSVVFFTGTLIYRIVAYRIVCLCCSRGWGYVRFSATSCVSRARATKEGLQQTTRKVFQVEVAKMTT